ncbi:MAG TPA: Asp-tRNA(Asn)/Glu-tRNA(Gln) amidotransferase GatCAB subunit A [Leptospiraceae bacterium]|nr:Asp-tRNA(Asn)/Glu-tRNA(Gln) amidotransferase GatCAB subunit A [Spirochaetaceae bacterium]HBS04919.1 Asp-tRNA(Asn)/Glu-tRNA(Gln) amidotransferase GatCAB subunit A [Leptospiraceae bacterium]|tara:strand:- start:10512 stop:11987 length:1476 start_codon:yes stop_codon:yes gene_type:complete
MIDKTATQHSQALDKGEYSSEELVSSYLDRARKCASLEMFNDLDEARIIEQAKQSDKRRKSGNALSALDGIPVAIKDNICDINEKTTCSSNFLKDYRSPYDATVIEKLKSAGAILYGRTNLDEFAMGSSTENSAFRTTRNPYDPDRVPGGSSGGSAAAVGSLSAPLALGSDTGGSIRQPASFCGIVGMKPTYGKVSRYGLVAFASSLDQIGPMALSVEDAAMLLHSIEGRDVRDSTSHPYADKHPTSAKVKPMTGKELKGKKVGVLFPDSSTEGFDASVLKACTDMRNWLEKQGCEVVEVQSKLWQYVIPIYYILATAEASSNLSRFDGIRYGTRSQQSNLQDLYVRSRTEGFGPEVKRRILLGTFVLSSGYFDAYYNSAQKARRMVRAEYLQFFKDLDFIVQPTSPTTAFKVGERAENPIAMYQSDLMTISVNLGGVPALSLPLGVDQDGLPVGMQITAPHFEEDKLFQFSAAVEKDFTLDRSGIVSKSY